MEVSLKQKTINGVSWSFVDSILGQGITFIVGLVLARLLSPAEFGLIGIITIFITLFNSIVDSGFSSALIRKNKVNQIDYDTVFLFNFILSVLLCGLLFVSAPSISYFFKLPLLTTLIRVMSFILIINSLGIIQRTILVKKVDFETQTRISVIASISSGVIGVGMAISGFGVWSLVIQQFTRQFLNTFFLWKFNDWRPIIQFSSKSFIELFTFGWKLLISGLIDSAWTQAFSIIIGKFYTPTTLGQYTRADQFKNLFSSNLTAVIQRVSYPVLSSIQNEDERMKQAYRKIIKTTMLVTFVCMLGLAAVSTQMITVLIGQKWILAATFLKIISFSGMLYPLHAINLNILQVKGRSDLFLKLEIIKKTISILPLILGIFISINWMLWGSVFTGFISYYLNSYHSGKEINYSMKDQIKDILPSFFISLLVAGSMWLLAFIPISPYILFPLQLSIGMLLLTLICEITEFEEYLEIKSIVFSIIKKITHGRH